VLTVRVVLLALGVDVCCDFQYSLPTKVMPTSPFLLLEVDQIFSHTHLATATTILLIMHTTHYYLLMELLLLSMEESRDIVCWMDHVQTTAQYHV
jgi:hypothetical protein